MRVPFVDLNAAYIELKAELDEAIQRVLDSGWYVLGAEVERFEEEFAAYCGARHAIGVGTGLDALTLALIALDIGEGDEVLVPSNTYIATWLAVSHSGAIPVPVEPNEGTCNIDGTAIEPAISERTKAIIPVHLYGQPADLDPILDVARGFGLAIVDDAAQAHGAEYKGKRVGTHADATAFSFYPTKNLGAFGDGGAITTNCDNLARNIRLLRNYGSQQKYVHEIAGFNSRLDPLQAAMLSVKLGRLDDWNNRRRDVAKEYTRAISNSRLQTVALINDVNPVWHVFAVKHPDRDNFRNRLEASGIATMVHYPVPPHMQAAYANLNLPTSSLPVAKKLGQELLSLPIGPHMKADEVEYVAECIVKYS